MIFKNCAPLTSCITKKSTQVDDAQDIDIVMSV